MLGGTNGALHLEIDGEVVAVTARRVPLMPLGIGVAAASLPPVPPGALAVLDAGTLRAGDLTVSRSGAPTWDPRVPVAGAEATARRGTGMLEELGDPGLEVAAGDLFAAVASGDPVRGAGCAACLVGRGGGLTPEGDDVLGGVAAALWAGGALDDAWRAALVPADLGERTGTLSAGLLRAAARGEVVEPLGVVLDAGATAGRWRPALARLLHIGHRTGRAWAFGAASAADALGRRTTTREGADR